MAPAEKDRSYMVHDWTYKLYYYENANYYLFAPYPWKKYLDIDDWVIQVVHS